MNPRTTSLQGIIERSSLWSAGAEIPEKLPWNDPAFSRRMLAEHLDQRHDHASRRLETIATHVGWIFDELLDRRPGRVLDLGCGPGLYTASLAARGCSCHGIDFSPAAMEYARSTATERDLDCTYAKADLASAPLGSGYDLAMMLFGEFNTFDRQTAADLTRRTWRALRPGGRLLIEAHTYAYVVESGRAAPTWYSSRGGLFSPRGHVVLTEHGFDTRSAATRTRHLVLEDGCAEARIYGEEMAAYSEEESRHLLAAAGFAGIEFVGGLGGATTSGMVAITAQRPRSEDSAAPDGT